MHYYKELASLAEKAIKLNDPTILALLLNTLLPEMDQQSSDNLEDIMEESLLDDISPEIEQIILSKFPMKQNQSMSYIMSRLSNPELNRRRIDIAIEGIGDLYGLCLTNAVYCGELEIARKIKRAFGDKKISVTANRTEKPKPVIDGAHEYDTKNLVLYKPSIEKLKAIINFASDSGLLDPILKTKSQLPAPKGAGL